MPTYILLSSLNPGGLETLRERPERMLEVNQEIERMGGLHEFMGWGRPILTDSGGYQVMSLSELAKTSEEGVRFKSHLDGSTHMLTPERSIEVQRLLGSDIVMAFDQLVPTTSSAEDQREAMDQKPGRYRFRELVGKTYGQLAIAHAALGKEAEAEAAIRERRRLWTVQAEPLVDVALDLGKCVTVVGNGKDRLTEPEEAARRKYADLAMDALREAVARGFQDLERLRTESKLGTTAPPVMPAAPPSPPASPRGIRPPRRCPQPRSRPFHRDRQASAGNQTGRRPWQRWATSRSPRSQELWLAVRFKPPCDRCAPRRLDSPRRAVEAGTRW